MKLKSFLICMIVLLVLLPQVLASQPYPDPNFNTTEGLIEYTNEVTGGWITILFMIVSVIVIFSMCQMKGYLISDSLLTAFFVSTVLGSFFWAANLIQGNIMVIYILLTIGSAIYSVLEG